MAVVFTESRKMPPEVHAMGQYRNYGDFGETNINMTTVDERRGMNAESAIADVFKSLTTGAVEFFGGKTGATRQAEAQAAAAQAQYASSHEYEEGQTKRTLIYAGAAVAGVLLLTVILGGGRSSVKVKNVSGHRSKRKRSRR